MKSSIIEKKHNLIVGLFIVVAVIVSALVFGRQGGVVNAEDDTMQYVDSSFHMNDGIALARTIDMVNNGEGIKVAFTLPENIMKKYQAGFVPPYDEVTSTAYEYYFCVYRLPAESDYSIPFSELFAHFSDKKPIYGAGGSGYTDYLQGSYCEFYHIDPSNCTLSASSLYSITDQGDGTYLCEIALILPTYVLPDGSYGFEHEFIYFIDFFEYRPERMVLNYSVGVLSPDYLVRKASETRHIGRTRNYVKRSVKNVALVILDRFANVYSPDEIRYFQFLALVNMPSDTFTVNLKYKVCIGFNHLQDITERYNVDSLYAFSGSAVYSSLSGLKGFSNVSFFNCVFKNVRNVVSEGSDVALLTDERILLQAADYVYQYDENQNVGTLEIIYRDYQYKDFAIQVRDNDDGDGTNLTFYVYPVDVTVRGDSVELIYNYSRIQTMLLNSCNWLFEINRENFTCVGTNAYVMVFLYDDYLKISFDLEHEEKLVNLRISFLAGIIEDYDCTMTLEYLSLDNNLNETVKTDVSVLRYSEYVKLGYGENLYNRYKGLINPAIHPDCLGGQDFYKFHDIFCTKTGDSSYKITVTYTFTTLFRLANDLTEEIVYQGLTKNSLFYFGVDLDYQLPSGYRISGVTSTDKYSITITNNEEYFAETKIVVNCATNEKRIIPLYATYVDTWHVNIEYLDRYKDSCFAVKVVEVMDLRISEYENIRAFTLEDVKALLDVQTMDLLKSQADDAVKVEFNGKSTYTVTVTYSFTTMRMSEACGLNGEVEVPLSNYADWCDGIGKDWSIMYLNNPEHKYFNYSNDVNRENLYGYFAAIVFNEQLKDINTWFAQETGEGAVVLSKVKEVRGSDFYKFLRGNTLTFSIAGASIGGLFGGVGGAIGGSMLGVGLNLGCAVLCEVSDSSNATYYTYFTYLDCSSSQAFLSRSGATDAYDTDGAFTNVTQKDAIDLTDFFSQFGDLGNGLVTVIGVLLGVVAVSFAVVLVIKIITWTGKGERKGKGVKENEDTKKRS